MGYCYYILIQGYKDNKWNNLDYKNNHGTYSCCGNHYFYVFMNSMSACKENLIDDMGDTQYIFRFEDIKADYERYITYRQNYEFKERAMEIIENSFSKKSLTELRDNLDKLINNTDDFDSELCMFLPELEEYYNKCMKYYGDYEDIRVIYGISP